MTIHSDMPYVFTPALSRDNGPQLRSILQAGYKWIQINGDNLRLDTTVPFNKSDGTPIHGLVLEPAPGIAKVTVDPSGIGRNPTVPSDPSYAAFDYQGNVRPGSYLTREAFLNQNEIFVGDASAFTNGDWIVISDASTNFPVMPLPLDGPMEVRQVLRVLGSSLVIKDALKTGHPNGAIVAKVTPIREVFVRGLEFTGNCSVGLHMHYAQNCVWQDITSVNWKGRVMALMDNGGSGNLIVDSYCKGTEPGLGPQQNTWGVVMEGQDGSRMVRCGGELCGSGSAMNYCIDSIALDAIATRNNVNVGVYTSSIRSGFLKPTTSAPLILDTNITPDCVDCYIVR